MQRVRPCETCGFLTSIHPFYGVNPSLYIANELDSKMNKILAEEGIIFLNLEK